MTQVNPGAGRPTVVLVHGAFADGSSWNGVLARLQAAGIAVTAPANPLRGIAQDSAYIRSVFDQIDGPIVAVGHSYAGAVITNAAAGAANVVGLVFVAAFAPDEGELLGQAAATSKDSVLMTVLVPHSYPGANGESATELTVDPARFHDVFAADLPETEAALMAATQRPIAEAAFSEPNGAPAWKHLPSWAIVAKADTAAGADLVRSMAERANAMIMEIDASHVVMVSQPEAVADLIVEAVEMVQRGARQTVSVG